MRPFDRLHHRVGLDPQNLFKARDTYQPITLGLQIENRHRNSRKLHTNITGKHFAKASG